MGSHPVTIWTRVSEQMLEQTGQSLCCQNLADVVVNPSHSLPLSPSSPVILSLPFPLSLPLFYHLSTHLSPSLPLPFPLSLLLTSLPLSLLLVLSLHFPLSFDLPPTPSCLALGEVLNTNHCVISDTIIQEVKLELPSGMPFYRQGAKKHSLPKHHK